MIDVGTPFSRSFESLINSLQTSLELGVEQPATLDILYQASTSAYQIRGAGPVSGLATQITGFIAGKPAIFNLNQHYRYAVGQLVWQPLDTSDPSLKAGWFPDDNSRLTVGYLYRDLPSGPFYGFNRPGVEPSEAIIANWWRQGMMGSAKAHYDGIVAFSQTDFTEDLKQITVPVLVMHGDDDQIVPYADSGPLSAALLQNGLLKTYTGFPHGMPTTKAATIDADLLEFIRS